MSELAFIAELSRFTSAIITLHSSLDLEDHDSARVAAYYYEVVICEQQRTGLRRFNRESWWSRLHDSQERRPRMSLEFLCVLSRRTPFRDSRIESQRSQTRLSSSISHACSRRRTSTLDPVRGRGVQPLISRPTEKRMTQARTRNPGRTRTHRRQLKIWISESDYEWLCSTAESCEESLSSVVRSLVKLGRSQFEAESSPQRSTVAAHSLHVHRK